MTRLRARVAQRLKGAQNTYAMLTTFNEIDMTNLMKLRSDYKVGPPVTLCATTAEGTHGRHSYLIAVHGLCGYFADMLCFCRTSSLKRMASS